MRSLFDINPWEGRQDRAFEELCYQIIVNSFPNNTIIRNGTPDGGVEFYRIFESGDEWGYQCKFTKDFDSMFDQIEKSVKTALDTHPRLTKYFIFHPQDFPDSRTGNFKSARMKWDDKVIRWKEIVSSKNMLVIFHEYGESFILNELTKEKNYGLRNFWFNEREFSNDWFTKHVNEMKANVGPRYSEELNISPPIVETFNFLERSPEVFKHIREEIKEILKNYEICKIRYPNLINKDLESYIDELNNENIKIESLEEFDTFIKISKRLEGVIDKLLTNISKVTASFDYHRFNYEDTERDKKMKMVYVFDTLYLSIRNLEIYIQSDNFKLVDNPFLLITGKAGMGKTHLIFDLILRRLSNNLFSLVFLGQHFINDKIYNNMNSILDISLSLEHLLQTLQSIARTKGRRNLICIDAINESNGNIWKNSLSGLIDRLKKYNEIGIVLTCRSGHEEYVIPDHLNNMLVRKDHQGFYGMGFQAIKKFFIYYNIKFPIIGVSLPFFTNPLYLKLFCQAFKNSSINNMDSKISFQNIIIKYIDNVNKVLFNELDYDPNDNLVKRAINNLIREMVKRRSIFLPYKDAKLIVDEIHKSDRFSSSLFSKIISNDVIAIDFLFSQKERVKIVRFPYEKFGDSLIVEFVLKKFLKTSNPRESFSEESDLYKWLENMDYTRRINIIDMLCISIPELTKYEFFEISPNKYKNYASTTGFLNSIIFRKIESLRNNTSENFNTLWNNEQINPGVLDIILQLSTLPHHPFNILYFHEYLFNMSLADRDYYWTTIISKSFFENENSIERILTWPLDMESELNSESLKLYGITLIWFLTSSNILLRDKATLVMINFFKNNIPILIKIMSLFLSINDMYVLERLFAIAYGCVLITKDDKQIQDLAEFTFNSIYKENPPLNILLRDHCRGIINIVRKKKLNSVIDFEKVFDRKNLSTMPNFDDMIENETRMQNDYNYSSLNSSLGGMGDFARYVLKTNRGSKLNGFDFDNSLARRYIYKRIKDFGWIPEKFKDFDEDYLFYKQNNRANNKIERIGKKYQWIALFELFAILEDNNIEFEDSNKNFRGPWQIYLRNIDPSFPVLFSNRNAYQGRLESFKSIIETYSKNNNWINDKEDISKICDTLFDSQLSEWLILNGNYQIDTEQRDKELFFTIDSFIIAKRESSFFFRNISQIIDEYNLNLLRLSQVYLGEYPDADSYEEYRSNGIIFHDGKIVGFNTTETYVWDTGYIDGPNQYVSVYLPSSSLVKIMNLENYPDELSFKDAEGKTICYDYAYNQNDQKSLFIDKSAITNLIKENNELNLIWIIRVQKYDKITKQHIDHLIKYDFNTNKIIYIL
jgi:hypothetical protein